MEEEKENKNSRVDRRRKRMFPFKSVHNTLNSSRVKNNTMNNSLIKSTLRTNNRALAKALQQKRADLQQSQNDVVLLQQENQMLLERVTTLDKVAGLKDQDIDAEVNRRLLKRLNDMMASLHTTCDSVMSFLSMFTETVHSCQSNNGSRNSSLGSERSSISSREKISHSVVSPSTLSPPGTTIETVKADRMPLEDNDLQLTPELAENTSEAPDINKASGQEASSEQPYQLHDLSVITEQSMIEACSKNAGRVFSVTGPRRILVDSEPGIQSEGFKGKHVTKRARRSKSLRSSGKGLVSEHSLQEKTATDSKSVVDETPQKICFDSTNDRQETAVEDVQLKTTEHSETKDEECKESVIPEHITTIVKDDAVSDETSEKSPKMKVRRSKHRRTRLISGSSVVEPNVASDTEKPSCILTSDNDQLSTKFEGIADSDMGNENSSEGRSSRVTRSKRRDTYCLPVQPPVIVKNTTEQVLPVPKSSKLPKPKVKVPSKETTHKPRGECRRKTFSLKQHGEGEELEQIDLQSMSILVDDLESESLDVDIDIVEPTPRKSESECLSLQIKRNTNHNKAVEAKNVEVSRDMLSDGQSKSTDKTKEHEEGMPVVSTKNEDVTMYNVEDMELTAVLPVMISSFVPSPLPSKTTADESSSKVHHVDIASENISGKSNDGSPFKEMTMTECSNAVIKKQTVLKDLKASSKVLAQLKDQEAFMDKSGETESNAGISDSNCSNNKIEVDNSNKDHAKVSEPHDVNRERNVVEMTKNEEALKSNKMEGKRQKTKKKTFSKPGLTKTRDDKPVSTKLKSSKKGVKVEYISSDGSQSDTEPAKKKSVQAFLSHPGKYWFSCGEPNQLKKSKGKSTLPVCQPKPRSRSKQRKFPSYDFPAEPKQSPSEKTVFDLSMGMNESVTVLPQTKYGDFRERKCVEKDLDKESQDETVDATHGIMLVLGNGKRTKPRVNKNVRYSRQAADIVTITPPPTSTNDEKPNEYIAHAGNTPKRPPKELKEKFDREVVQGILISPSGKINAQNKKLSEKSFDNKAEVARDPPMDDTETRVVSQNNLSIEKSPLVKDNEVLLEKNDNSEQLVKLKTSGIQATEDLIDQLNEGVNESGAEIGKESTTEVQQNDLGIVNELDSPLFKARSRRRTKKVQRLRDESESDEEYICQNNKTKREKSLKKPEKRETKSNIEHGSSESTSRSTGEGVQRLRNESDGDEDYICQNNKIKREKSLKKHETKSNIEHGSSESTSRSTGEGVQRLRNESDGAEDYICQNNKTKREKSLKKPEKRETKSNIEHGSSESTSRSTGEGVQRLRNESDGDEDYICQNNKTKREKSLKKPEKRETKSNIEHGSSESTSRSTGESHNLAENQTCSPGKRKLSANIDSIEVAAGKRSRRGASTVCYVESSPERDSIEVAAGKRSRRAASNVCYVEPSLGSKLRRGDKCTSTIYSGRDAKLVIEGAKKKTGKSKKGVRKSGIKTNLFDLE